MAEKTWPKQRRRAPVKFWPKIECTRPVQYVDSHMARSHRLTCLQTEVNNLLK